MTPDLRQADWVRVRNYLGAGQYYRAWGLHADLVLTLENLRRWKQVA